MSLPEARLGFQGPLLQPTARPAPGDQRPSPAGTVRPQACSSGLTFEGDSREGVGEEPLEFSGLGSGLKRRAAFGNEISAGWKQAGLEHPLADRDARC